MKCSLCSPAVETGKIARLQNLFFYIMSQCQFEQQFMAASTFITWQLQTTNGDGFVKYQHKFISNWCRTGFCTFIINRTCIVPNSLTCCLIPFGKVQIGLLIPNVPSRQHWSTEITNYFKLSLRQYITFRCFRIAVIRHH